jgi:hypothetical protein
LIKVFESEIQTIVTERNEAAAIKIEQIRNNTKLQLDKLNVKYAISDTIKMTSGFIAIGTLSSLASLLIINECINLFKYLFGKEISLDVKRRKNSNNNDKITRPVYVPRQ